LPSWDCDFYSGYFVAARAEALRKHQDKVRSGVDILLSDPTAIVDGIPQSFNGVENIMSILPEFASIAGVQPSNIAWTFLQDNWRSFTALGCELYALSLVSDAAKPRYLLARASSFAFYAGPDLPGLQLMMLKVLAIPAVVELVGLFRHVVGTPDNPVGPDGVVSFDQQSLISEVLRMTAASSMSPGSAVHAIVAISAAAYAVFASKSMADFNFSVVISAVTGLVLKLPKVDTPEEVVAVLLRSLPTVIGAVTTAIEMRSLMPLLTGGDSTFMRVVAVQTAFDLHKIGKYDPMLFADEKAFRTAVEDVCTEVEPLVKRGNLQAMRDWRSLCTIRTYMRAANLGKFKAAPFCFALVGASGVGKTDLLYKAMHGLAWDHFGETLRQEQIYTKQPTDKHWSGYSDRADFCVFDDMSNAKSSAGTPVPNPTDPLIYTVNNITSQLPMADLESKGRVTFSSKFVAVTSNIVDLKANMFSECPESVLRRFNVVIEPIVRPEFRKGASLAIDKAKIPPKDVCEVPNTHSFRLFYWEKNEDSLPGVVAKVYLDFPEEAGILELIELLVQLSRLHFANQDGLVKAHSLASFKPDDIRRFRQQNHAYANRAAPVVGPAQPIQLVREDYGQEVAERDAEDAFIDADFADREIPVDGAGELADDAPLEYAQHGTCMSKSLLDNVFCPLGLPARAESGNVLVSQEFVPVATDEPMAARIERCARARVLEPPEPPPVPPPQPRYLLFGPVGAFVARRVEQIYGGVTGYLVFYLMNFVDTTVLSLVESFLRWYSPTIITQIMAFSLFTGMWFLQIFLLVSYVFLIIVRNELVARLNVMNHANRLLVISAVGGLVGYMVTRRIMSSVKKRPDVVLVTRNEPAVAVKTPPVAEEETRVPLGPVALPGIPEGIVEFTMASTFETSVLNPKVAAPVATTATLGQLRLAMAYKSLFVLFCAGFGVDAILRPGVLTPICTGLYCINKHILLPILESVADTILLVCYAHNSTQKRTFRISRRQIYLPDSDYDIAFVHIVGPKEKDLRPFLMHPDYFRDLCNQNARFPVGDAMLLMTRVPAAVLSGKVEAAGMVTAIDVRLAGRPVSRNVRFGDVVTKAIVMLACSQTMPGDCGSPMVMSLSASGKLIPVFAGIHAGMTQMGSDRFAIITPLLPGAVAAALEKFSTTTFQSARLSLFGLSSQVFLDPSRSHPQLPQPGGDVVPLGVLVNSRGENTASINSSSSNLTRGVFYESKDMDEKLGELTHQFPPFMRDIAHYARPLNEMAQKCDNFDVRALEAAIQDYALNLQLVAGDDLPPGPASLLVACNLDTEAGIPPVQVGTSSGVGRKGPKYNYLVDACVPNCTVSGCTAFHPLSTERLVPGRPYKYADPDLEAEVSLLIEELIAGKMDLTLFKAALKDEPVARGKNKVRAFYVGNLAVLLVCRMYFGPLLGKLHGKPRYECALGMDTMSRQWEDLMVRTERFDESNGHAHRLAGDYKAFDLSTHSALLAGFYDSLVELALKAGWTPRDIAVLRGLGKNLSNPVYIFLGQVVRVRGSNPSGINCTTDANSGVNSILHRVAFYTKNPELIDSPKLANVNETLFTSAVSLITYGDDAMGSVDDSRFRPINNGDVAAAAATFGMTFGPVNKTDAFLPEYYDAAQADFLKCTSTMIPELGFRIGRIPLASIRKSLAFERTPTFEARCSTLQAALRLYYPHCAMHGRDVGETKFSSFRDVLVRKAAELLRVSESEVPDSLLPSYDDVARVVSLGEANVSVGSEELVGEY
jgi:hypothetical protein